MNHGGDRPGKENQSCTTNSFRDHSRFPLKTVPKCSNPEEEKCADFQVQDLAQCFVFVCLNLFCSLMLFRFRQLVQWKIRKVLRTPLSLIQKTSRQKQTKCLRSYWRAYWISSHRWGPPVTKMRTDHRLRRFQAPARAPTAPPAPATPTASWNWVAGTLVHTSNSEQLMPLHSIRMFLTAATPFLAGDWSEFPLIWGNYYCYCTNLSLQTRFCCVMSWFLFDLSCSWNDLV